MVYNAFDCKKNQYCFRTDLLEGQERDVKREDNIPKLLHLIYTINSTGRNANDIEIRELDEINKRMLVTDLLSCLTTPSLKRIFGVCVVKNYLLNLGYSRDVLDTATQEKLQELVDSNNIDEYENEYGQAVTATLLFHIEYLLIDRYALVFLQRSIEKYNRDSQLCCTADELFSASKALQDLINNVSKSGIVTNSTSVSIVIDQKEQVIDMGYIRNKQKEFVDGLYITPDIMRAIINMIVEKRDSLNSFSAENIKRMNFQRVELEAISLVDFSNLQVLFNNEKIDKNFIDRLVRHSSLGVYKDLQKDNENDQESIWHGIQLPSTVELLNYLSQNGIISSRDLYEYYLNNVIKLEELECIEKSSENPESFTLKFREEIVDNDFLKIYKEYIQRKIEYEAAVKSGDDNVESYKKIMELQRHKKDRLLLLYKKYKLANLCENERKLLVEEMLLNYCLEIPHENDGEVTESLREMYKDGLITFEDISNLDDSYLQTVIIDIMFVRGELTLEDTQKLRDSLDLETLTGIINKALANPEISQTQKFCLIRNIFHRDLNDDEIAKLFLSKLSAKDYRGVEYDVIKKIVMERPNQNPSTPTLTRLHNPAKKYVYPQYVKWEFLQALDKDARITLYKNGYVEFFSEKLGVRIIEKYLEVNKDGCIFDKDAYGYSTCIMNEETYREFFDYLVDEQLDGESVLNPKTLLQLVPREDRVAHNTQSPSKNWMRSVAKYFDIDLEMELELVEDSRYTKEELAQIRQVIKKYENEYIEIDGR